jgi:hypothetical protein
MRERTPQSMLQWISTSYDMSPSALARMFQRNRRTVQAWLKQGRITPENGTKIRSAFYYLNNEPDPHRPDHSGVDMI